MSICRRLDGPAQTEGEKKKKDMSSAASPMAMPTAMPTAMSTSTTLNSGLSSDGWNVCRSQCQSHAITQWRAIHGARVHLCRRQYVICLRYPSLPRTVWHRGRLGNSLIAPNNMLPSGPSMTMVQFCIVPLSKSGTTPSSTTTTSNNTAKWLWPIFIVLVIIGLIAYILHEKKKHARTTTFMFSLEGVTIATPQT